MLCLLLVTRLKLLNSNTEDFLYSAGNEHHRFPQPPNSNENLNELAVSQLKTGKQNNIKSLSVIYISSQFQNIKNQQYDNMKAVSIS